MKIIITIFTMMLLAFAAISQTPTEIGPPPGPVVTTADTISVFPNPVSPTVSIEWLINAENGLYAGLLFVLSFLSFVIPGINRIPEKIVRTLAIGASLLVLFVGYKARTGSFNAGEVISLVISYLITTGAMTKYLSRSALPVHREQAAATRTQPHNNEKGECLYHSMCLYWLLGGCLSTFPAGNRSHYPDSRARHHRAGADRYRCQVVPPVYFRYDGEPGHTTGQLYVGSPGCQNRFGRRKRHRLAVPHPNTAKK